MLLGILALQFLIEEVLLWINACHDDVDCVSKKGE